MARTHLILRRKIISTKVEQFLSSTRLDECKESKYLRGKKRQEKYSFRRKKLEFWLKPEKWHPYKTLVTMLGYMYLHTG